MNKILCTLLIALFAISLTNAQNCDTELSSLEPGDLNNENWVVPASGITCVSSDITIQRLEIANGGTLVIKPGVTLTIIGNEVYPGSFPDRNSTIKIYGALKFNQASTIPMSSDITVFKNGELSVNNGYANLDFKGSTVNFTNHGLVKVAVLDFTNSSATVTFDNLTSGNLEIGSNINIRGTTKFRNLGSMTVGASFNNNANSIYVNCGTIHTQGFNLHGGKIYNTGTFTATDRIEMGNSNSEFNNYGVFNGTSFNLEGATINNTGLFTLTGIIDSGGHLIGPSTGTNYGKFNLVGLQNMNYGTVQGNLHIINTNNGSSTQNDIFRANIIVDSSVVFGTCAECTVVSTGVECPNPDGVFTPFICTEGPTYGDVEPNTYVGISTLDRNIDGSWATNAQNGFIKLESETLGFVPTRLTTAQRDALNAEEGMMIWNITTQCLEFYNGTTWVCGKNKCNP